MEVLHLLSLAFSAACILWSDHLGFLYFIGAKKTLPFTTMQRLHYAVWIGLLGMIASGIALTLPAWSYYMSDPAYIVKMLFVLVLVINGIAIGFLMPISTKIPFVNLPKSTKTLLLISGAASATSWIAATLIGFFWL